VTNEVLAKVLFYHFLSVLASFLQKLATRKTLLRLRVVAGHAGSSPDYNLSELVKAMNIKHGTGASCHHQDAPLVPSPTGMYSYIANIRIGLGIKKSEWSFRTRTDAFLAVEARYIKIFRTDATGGGGGGGVVCFFGILVVKEGGKKLKMSWWVVIFIF
jgi:hypothetical protein